MRRTGSVERGLRLTDTSAAIAGSATSIRLAAPISQPLRQPTAAPSATNTIGSTASPRLCPRMMTDSARPRCAENQRAVAV